jgi:CRP-like cAMP-binding protein
MSLASDSLRPRILIVEDSYLISDEVGELVRDCGYAVAGTTPSIEGGLRAVEEERLDGAVLDIDLAGRPSFPVCSALQARGIPFVFLSGYGPGIMVPKEFRAAPHLGKPADRRQLQSVLHELIDVGRFAARSGNAVLDSLTAGERADLRESLESVDLRAGDLLEVAGQPVTHVYFPVNALISIIAGADRGSRIEVASIGRDGMTAPGLLLGDTTALAETVVQSAGRAWRLSAAELLRLSNCNPALRRRLLRELASTLHQLVETSMFHGRATIVERLARWLVLAMNRLETKQLLFTHDALAEILGVRRPSVSIGLQILEGRHLIRATRRVIVILDAAGLADLSRLSGSWESRLMGAKPPVRTAPR